jgi:hypothetical protein
MKKQGAATVQQHYLAQARSWSAQANPRVASAWLVHFIKLVRDTRFYRSAIIRQALSTFRVSSKTVGFSPRQRA